MARNKDSKTASNSGSDTLTTTYIVDPMTRSNCGRTDHCVDRARCRRLRQRQQRSGRRCDQQLRPPCIDRQYVDNCRHPPPTCPNNPSCLSSRIFHFPGKPAAWPAWRQAWNTNTCSSIAATHTIQLWCLR